MITGDQIRQARKLLGWPSARLPTRQGALSYRAARRECRRRAPHNCDQAAWFDLQRSWRASLENFGVSIADFVRLGLTPEQVRIRRSISSGRPSR